MLRSCVVRMTVEDGELNVIVTDDGVGLPAQVRGGAGLRSMRERAEELVGSLTIAVVRPHGTSVSARLPLPAGERV
jgi:signal transduction histidine kinase